MHLDLNYGPFVPHIKSWEPHNLANVPDGPQAHNLNTLRFEEKGTQIRASE